MPNEKADPSIIQHFALDDIVYEAGWLYDTAGREIQYQARFVGASGNDTIHFRLRRYISSVPDSSKSMVYRPPAGMPVPQYSDVRIGLSTGVGAAAWQSGPGNNDIEFCYYRVSNQGLLLLVKPPEPIEMRPIGLRLPQKSTSE